MLDKTISYRSLFRVVGTLLLLDGLYLVIWALTAQQTTTFGTSTYTNPSLFVDSRDVFAYIFNGGPLFASATILPRLPEVAYWQPGPLLVIGIGIVLLAFTTAHVRLIYWSLQVALWFTSMSFWFAIRYLLHDNAFNPSLDNSIVYILVTLALSLVLFALYIPITRLLKKRLLPNGTLTTTQP